MSEFDDMLAHFGVKGMKWGVRRNGTASASLSRPSGDRKEVNAILTKPTASLTNRQLKTANNRLQLERSYTDLTKKPTSLDRIKKGTNAANAVLAVAGVGVTAYSMAKSPAGQAAIKVGMRATKPIRIAVRAKRAFG